MGFPPAMQLIQIIPALLAILTVAIILQVLQSRLQRKGYALPPGPTPLPLFGSALSLKSRDPWLIFTEWRAKYGDIMYMRLLGSNVVVLNATSVASELLEKRSRIYSDRPFFPTVTPYGLDCNFSLLPYGDRWRLCRRIFQQTFRANMAMSFRQMQLHTAKELLISVIKNPNDFPSHFTMFSATIAMSVAYGYDPKPHNDPMVVLVDKYLQISMQGLKPMNLFLLKLFPFLTHVPEWLPGSWITRESREACESRDKMVETPYQYVQEHMTSEHHISMVADHIRRMDKLSGLLSSEYEMALKSTSTTAFLGSVETTGATLMAFTLAMVLHPHVWKRAQLEIDAVVGTDRLPEFEDRPSLPYVDAIIRETLRWVPVTPLGGPHATTESDVYKGYFIPEGSIILVNVWGISRDEARYIDANEFIPERFLNGAGLLVEDNPAEFVFGFGRRRCPGRHIADGSLWSAIATMLATLDFNLAKDAGGSEISFKPTFTKSLVIHTDPFPCQLSPRPRVKRGVLDPVYTRQ